MSQRVFALFGSLDVMQESNRLDASKTNNNKVKCYPTSIMNRALLNVSLCRSCRHEIGRSFSSVSGVSISRYNSLSSPRSYANRRPFSSVPRLLSDIPSVNPSESRAQVADEKELQSETESSAAKQHIPWYLQEETPITESQPVSSRDHLPELPEDPPAILPDLLEYTFKDLGLDNLKLFDLRVLETPPALGANVIMIIGTARSVKHINVAADRLCRWLRTTYKLTPYADGLLGRNELKIKLRRKARRARIASQSGAMVDERDDGITTGWICVNAGVVEDAPAVEQEAKDQGFEGFGSISAGTRVVVQIFTEEKRAEVDLDALWQGNLDRAERQRQRDSRAIANAPPKEVRAPQTTNRLSSDRDFRDVSRPQVSVPLEQRRGLHSTRPLRTHLNDESVDSLRAEPAPIQDSTHSSDNLGALIQHLSGLSDEQACHELGTGPEDRDSTLVLRRFYDWPPDFSAGNAALAHIQLMCVAISRQHQAYSKEGLWKAFVDYSLRNYPVSEDLGLRVVSALLTKQPVDRGLLDTDKEFALRALEHLSLRGAKVLNMKVLTMLYQAFSPEGVEVVSQDSKEGQALFRISKLIEILDIPFDPEQARTLMVSLFRNEDYDGFWKLWRKLALSGSPRTAADYERLFELHAELGDERRARDCIAAWVPMMSRENPPVALQGPILQHVMYCLVIADPEIQQTASEGSMSNLARLWRECRGKMLAEDGQF